MAIRSRGKLPGHQHHAPRDLNISMVQSIDTTRSQGNKNSFLQLIVVTEVVGQVIGVKEAVES